MARVSGPLMSMDASGTVAGSITFTKWKGRNVVRRHAIPSNPKSAKQVAVRSAMRFLSQAWSKISIAATPQWQDLADATKISPFNAFIQRNLRNFRDALMPVIAPQYTGAGDLETTQTVVAAGGVRSLSLTITTSAYANDWGYVVYRKLGAAPTGIWSEICAVVPQSGSADSVFNDTPLAAGVWHYKVLAFDNQGGKGTLTADESDTVTDA